jgi:hypothetical protein
MDRVEDDEDRLIFFHQILPRYYFVSERLDEEPRARVSQAKCLAQNNFEIRQFMQMLGLDGASTKYGIDFCPGFMQNVGVFKKVVEAE